MARSMARLPYQVVLAESRDVSAEYLTLRDAVDHAQQDSEFGVVLPDGSLHAGYAALKALAEVAKICAG